MTIEPHKMVKIHYTLKDDDGAVIDTSEGREPLEFMSGVGALIPGMEQALEGKKTGDKFSSVIEPAMGYGERDPLLVQEVDRSQFDGLGDMEIKVGMKFQAGTATGPILVTVTEVREDKIVVDANHELAGKTLHFDVEVVDVRDATEEDLKPYMPSGGCGGSCGGCGGCGSSDDGEGCGCDGGCSGCN